MLVSLHLEVCQSCWAQTLQSFHLVHSVALQLFQGLLQFNAALNKTYYPGKSPIIKNFKYLLCYM